MAEPTSNKAFPVSWDQFHRDARALAWRLAEKGPFEAMVCITRGGLVPAAIICRELGLRLIETVCVAGSLPLKRAWMTASSRPSPVLSILNW